MEVHLVSKITSEPLKCAAFVIETDLSHRNSLISENKSDPW